MHYKIGNYLTATIINYYHLKNTPSPPALPLPSLSLSSFNLLPQNPK